MADNRALSQHATEPAFGWRGHNGRSSVLFPNKVETVALLLPRDLDAATLAPQGAVLRSICRQFVADKCNSVGSMFAQPDQRAADLEPLPLGRCHGPLVRPNNRSEDIAQLCVLADLSRGRKGAAD